TVDGLKAFHARRCGLRLVPDWPMDRLLDASDIQDPPGAAIAEAEGFRFDADAMLACAWGRPSRAFGPMYARFDGAIRAARLPSPPYHFVSRVEQIEGPIGGMKVGTRCVTAYDVPPDAWYFDDGGTRAMPYAVLLEAALQPCGWLASYVGSALTSSGELFFRNLDGTGTLHREVLPDVGTILTAVTLTKLSQSGGMIICAFEVRCTDRHGAPIWTMDTVFGFFPAAALDAQRGLGPDVDAEAAWAAPGDGEILLREEARRFRGASARLGGGRLALLDRLTGLWPEGGKAGLGRVRGRMDVHPRLWFFSAHFFQDPVQPGSLGLEAIEQGLRALLIAKGLATDGQRFQSLAVEVPVTWRYRGQVRPHNTSMDVVVDLVELREEEGGLVAVADADLWCDGLRIYRASGMAVRVLPVEPTDREPGRRRVSLTTEPWLTDHRPTFTAPAIPMMDLAAFVLRSAPGAVGLRGLELTRWHTVGEELL
ncbi:MAG: 3-hydroxyacyl-[acyl-carrier-protein] dehydratase FabA, partial [Myxococcales bacterium]|nr:3-hydroxyacyl-[acyl-carrier-protein] dehydratase FabA [Myxococcales bacterium]